MDVELVRWPQEQDRREELRARGHPRLLLVNPDQPPPAVTDPLEDWIRLPASDDDVDARTRTLLHRIGLAVEVRPTLDPDGVLRHADGWVSLPPVEARLMSALLGRFGAVVSRDQLARAGWPQGAPGRNALDVHMLRVRRRIAPLDLVIRTIRSRGYLLESSDAGTDMAVPTSA